MGTAKQHTRFAENWCEGDDTKGDSKESGKPCDAGCWEWCFGSSVGDGSADGTSRSTSLATVVVVDVSSSEELEIGESCCCGMVGGAGAGWLACRQVERDEELRKAIGSSGGQASWRREGRERSPPATAEITVMVSFGVGIFESAEIFKF